MLRDYQYKKTLMNSSKINAISCINKIISCIKFNKYRKFKALKYHTLSIKH